MLIWPHLTLDLLGLVLGVGMLVVGIAHILIYFTKDNLGSILQPDLTVGVILAAFGAFMLMHMDFVPMILPFGAGILLLIGGITKVQYAIDMKRLYFSKWMTLLIFSGILILLGVILLYNPFKDNVLIYFIGSCLILDGLLSIVSVLMITHRKKQFDRGKVPNKVLARINGPVKSEVVEEPETSTDLKPAKKHHFFGGKSHKNEAEMDVVDDDIPESELKFGSDQTSSALQGGHANQANHENQGGHVNPASKTGFTPQSSGAAQSSGTTPSSGATSSSGATQFSGTTSSSGATQSSGTTEAVMITDNPPEDTVSNPFEV